MKNSSDTMRPLLRLSEVSRLLGVSMSCLRLWDRDGKIKVTRTAGGHRRVSQDEVDRLIADGPETVRLDLIRAALKPFMKG